MARASAISIQSEARLGATQARREAQQENGPVAHRGDCVLGDGPEDSAQSGDAQGRDLTRDEMRTRDIELGKVALDQRSCSRSNTRFGRLLIYRSAPHMPLGPRWARQFAAG